MNILNITSYHLPGKRFNGLSIKPYLIEYGINSKHVVLYKDKEEEGVVRLNNWFNHKINQIAYRVENYLSLQSYLYPHVINLMRLKEFKEADIIHCHIIYPRLMRIADLPIISKTKPVIWTLHDPWPLTGHCIHPMECQKWKTGCGNCPDLTREFPLRRDNTKFLFDYKKLNYDKSNLNLVVSSDWMMDMVKQSPMFSDHKVYKIPFGIDIDHFSPGDNNKARQELGINEDDIVIFFRADVNNKFKGFEYIKKALDRLKYTDKKICLLTVGNTDLLDDFKMYFKIIECGWIHDENLLRDLMRASDIFLMPSIAESFGMMAIEAMACAKPVIVFAGTALPDITFAPEVGISVPAKDAEGLASAILSLVDNPEERRKRGALGRQKAEEFYNIKTYAAKTAELYKAILNR